jgi:hypothetical protein
VRGSSGVRSFDMRKPPYFEYQSDFASQSMHPE